MRRVPFTILVLPCVLAMACPRRTSEPSSPSVTLAFTSHVRGWLEPCGCSADPLGGIDRIRGELARMRAKDGVLLFDSGSMLFDKMEIPPAALCQEEARVQLLVRHAREAGLVVTGIGPFDMARGEAWRAEVLRAAGLPALGANVEGAVARLVKEQGGIRVGFTGVTWPPGRPLPADGEAPMAWLGLRLSDPVRAAQAAVASSRAEGARVVVLLSQLERARTVELARRVPGIDLVVQGHEPGEQPAPPEEIAKGTWMLSAGQQGQYLARVTVRLPSTDPGLRYDDLGKGARTESERLHRRARQLEDQAGDFQARGDVRNAEVRRGKAAELHAKADEAAKRTTLTAAHVNAFTFEALPLDSHVVADAAASAELKAFKESLKELNLRCEAQVTCPPAKAGEASYVGSRACAECHDEAFTAWTAHVLKDPERGRENARHGRPNTDGLIGHSRAWQTLVDRNATSNRDCIGCHSVGFSEPGGFCKVADAPRWSDVGCESCHGPGSLHVDGKGPIRREVPESVCRSCHQVPHIPSSESFVYRDKVRFVLGPGHGGRSNGVVP